MDYDLGYFDLETRVLEPLDNPFGPSCYQCSRYVVYSPCVWAGPRPFQVYGTGLKSPQLNNALTHIGFDRDRTDKQKFCVTAKYAQSYLIEKDLQDLTRECRTSRVLVCYAKFSIL